MVNKKIYLDKLYHYLYDDATIFLERKHSILKECLETSFEKSSNNIENLTYNKQTKSMSEWATVLNISKRDLFWRLKKYNWDENRCLNPNFKMDSYSNRIYFKGEDNPNAVFTNEQVIEIFKSKESNRSLSEKYGVHRSTIEKIRSGTNYNSVTKNTKK